MKSELLRTLALVGCVGFAMTAASATHAQQKPEYVENTFTCDWNEAHQCGSPGKSPYTFNFMLFNKQGYIVDMVWLLARYSAASSPYRTDDFMKIGLSKKDLLNKDGIIFSFNAEKLASALDQPVSVLKKGVEVKMELESVGSGGGRRASCKIVDLKYSDSQSTWAWSLEGSSTWTQAAAGKFAFFNSGGQVNSVECRFDKLEGSSVS